MFRFLALVWLATATICDCAGAADFNVYLFGGQSNAVGRPRISYQVSAPDKRVKLYYDIAEGDLHRYDMTGLASPVGNDPTLPRWLQTYPLVASSLGPQPLGDTMRTGPEVAFGRRVYFVLHDQNAMIIKYAVGGSRLDGEWLGSKSIDHADRMILLFSRVKALVEANGDTFKVRAYIHNQGESDTYSQQTADNYYANLNTVIGKVKAFAGNKRLPIIVTRIHADYNSLAPAESAMLQPKVDTVRAAQEQIVSEDKCNALVDTDALMQKELWHYVDPYALGVLQFDAARRKVQNPICVP